MNYQQFVKERNEALLSLNKKKILAHLAKYGIHAPANETVFWAGIHKAICNITNIPDKKKEKSRTWLKAHNFKETMFQ